MKDIKTWMILAFHMKVLAVKIQRLRALVEKDYKKLQKDYKS